MQPVMQAVGLLAMQDAVRRCQRERQAQRHPVGQRVPAAAGRSEQRQQGDRPQGDGGVAPGRPVEARGDAFQRQRARAHPEQHRAIVVVGGHLRARLIPPRQQPPDDGPAEHKWLAESLVAMPVQAPGADAARQRQCQRAGKKVIQEQRAGIEERVGVEQAPMPPAPGLPRPQTRPTAVADADQTPAPPRLPAPRTRR